MRTYSILRTKEDACLAGLTLSGRTIDLGGHKGSSYYRLLKADRPVEVANFDEVQEGTHKSSSRADHTFDLEQSFALENETFDNVLCINVLEHIYHYENVLRESHRILKPEGRLYISVPFFFNIHGSPSDYFRYTRNALERLLAENGFENITITELGDGPCSAVFQTFGGSIPTMLLKMFFKRGAMTTDRVLSRISKRYASIRSRVPLGYFVSARKGGSAHVKP